MKKGLLLLLCLLLVFAALPVYAEEAAPTAAPEAEKATSGPPLSLMLSIVLAGVLSVAVSSYLPTLTKKKKTKPQDSSQS